MTSSSNIGCYLLTVDYQKTLLILNINLLSNANSYDRLVVEATKKNEQYENIPPLPYYRESVDSIDKIHHY
jgi:hypothetical protein